ncbi:hypothetical protein GGI43DRAFT_433939 [Trichoderma evansii]
MASHTSIITSWKSLPAEIRITILELVAHQKHPGWASLASVCRQWQDILEKANYRKLKIRSSRLGEFTSMVPPNKRHLIRHIWFDIELRRYNLRCCSNWRSTMEHTGRTVTKAVRKIYSILSSWEAANELTLELNVVCPSDSEHFFPNLYFSTDYVENEEEALEPYVAVYPYNDPNHGWLHGVPVGLPSMPATHQLLHPIRLELNSKTLPIVKAVTQLIIHRQLRHDILPFSLAELLQSLPCLENIVYEPWDSKDMFMELEDESLSFIIRNQLPKRLKRLVVFQDSNNFHRTLPISFIQLAPLDRQDRYDEAFAFKSLELSHLVVSFMVDAEDMFRICQPIWIWPKLQTLSLTSQLLQSDYEERDEIDALLCRAGNLVQQISKMRTFVLWNCGKDHACAFMYRVDRNDYPSITWRGTWHLEMSPCIIESWQNVASTLPSCRLGIREEHIEKTIGSHADAIYYLKLPIQVVEPASLWQMRREAKGLYTVSRRDRSSDLCQVIKDEF